MDESRVFNPDSWGRSTLNDINLTSSQINWPENPEPLMHFPYRKALSYYSSIYIYTHFLTFKTSHYLANEFFLSYSLPHSLILPSTLINLFNLVLFIDIPQSKYNNLIGKSCYNINFAYKIYIFYFFYKMHKWFIMMKYLLI